jgi:F0F1-type ATP synthase delta subunit
MPSIKEIEQIIDATPTNQAILLEGIHGIGKSEVVTSLFKKKGTRVVTLFLGQLSDAGDAIGLPYHSEDENGNKVTEFAPPAWWPFDMEEKLLIFLDELNRAKPELMQCIMDMVLNRKLNGRSLPHNTRIIAGMNPLNDDGYYQVDELDPALLDRFNRYEFKPSIDEWLDWAVKEKLHKYVIGFISKRQEFLDPKIDLDQNGKSNVVQPSRRSWKRLSDILNNNKDLNGNTLLNLCLGIIGTHATAAFKRYIAEEGKGLHAGKVVTSWDKGVEAKVSSMSIQEMVGMNKEICLYLDEHYTDMKSSVKVANAWSTNIQKYLETINPEAMAEFFDNVGTANNKNKVWPNVLLEANPGLASKFLKIMQGEREESWEE